MPTESQLDITMGSEFNNLNPLVEPEIKWCTLENADATATLKQHGYIKKTKHRPYTDETYEGNAQLCNKRGFCSDDGEGAMEFDKIDFYNLEPSSDTCKKCLKIYSAKKAQLSEPKVE